MSFWKLFLLWMMDPKKAAEQINYETARSAGGMNA